MAHKDVHITCAAGECRANPPDPTISKPARESILWHAANSRVTIRFPTACPFGWTEAEIAQGATFDSGPVQQDCAGGGAVYEYTVFCHDCKKPGEVRFGKGKSNPEVIINP